MLATAITAYLRAQHQLVPRVIQKHRRTTENTFLDVGAGDGQNAAWLRAGPPLLHVTCVDIADENRFEPSIVYDGERLPFAEKSFDSAVIAFVLHHIPSARQREILREVMRVARERIYVFEDCIASGFDRCLCARHQRAFATSTVDDARSSSAWRELFAESGLSVEFVAHTSRFIAPWIRGCKCYLVRRAIFVLRIP